MVTAPYRACAMQLHRRCEEKFKMGAERKAKGLEKKKQAKEMKQKPLYKMIRSYDKGVSEARSTIDKLEETMTSSLYDYTHLPGLKLAGDEVETNTKVGCRRFCDVHAKCKAYSYSEVKMSCFWSQITLMYDPGFTLYVKDFKNGGANHKFFSIPGLKGQEEAESVFTDTMSFGECQYKCFTDDTCASFSYNKESGVCNGMGAGFEYDSEYQYYEKQTPLKGGRPEDKEMMRQRYVAENEEKKHLKGQLNMILKASSESKPKSKAQKRDLGASRASSAGWTPLVIPTQVPGSDEESLTL